MIRSFVNVHTSILLYRAKCQAYEKCAFDIKCVRFFSVTSHQNMFYCNKYVMSCP